MFWKIGSEGQDQKIQTVTLPGISLAKFGKRNTDVAQTPSLYNEVNSIYSISMYLFDMLKSCRKTGVLGGRGKGFVQCPAGAIVVKMCLLSCSYRFESHGAPMSWLCSLLKFLNDSRNIPENIVVSEKQE